MPVDSAVDASGQEGAGGQGGRRPAWSPGWPLRGRKATQGRAEERTSKHCLRVSRHREVRCSFHTEIQLHPLERKRKVTFVIVEAIPGTIPHRKHLP